MSSYILLTNFQYIPHGHCYLWQTGLLGLHVTADTLIAIAYFSIPICLIYFVRQVETLPFKNIFILFSAFIISCGITHLLEIWTLWHPNYWFYGIFKVITALISLYTAASLFPILPQALKLPSTEYLAVLNQQLNAEIIEKETAKKEIEILNQSLEQRVLEKTNALVKANQDLIESTRFREKLTDLTPNILYIYDLVTESNIYCNPFITELLGYTPLQLQKFKDGLIDELIHPEDLPFVKEHFGRCLTLKDDYTYLEIEYRIKNHRGEWHWLQDKNAVFSRDKNNIPQQIIGIASDVTETKKLNQKLSEKITILELKNKARFKQAAMNEFLQACTNLEEAKKIIGDLLSPLFPNSSGVIYLVNDSKNIVDTFASWGKTHSKNHFEPRECWAIRKGNLHTAYPDSPGLYCSHVKQENNLSPSLCLPMIAKGENIGILHICFEHTPEIDRAIQELAETVAQNLAISFANLKLQQKLRSQSFRDALTGLYNRRYLLESLSKELERAHRKKQFVSIIMIDVDHFKRFNDVYGHSAGDLVLSRIGAYILSEVRQYDVACRYGGEELTIVMPDASLENTIIRAEKIRQGIKQLQIRHDGQKLESVTVSMGVSCFPDDGIAAEDLISIADKALYRAKEKGRDCVMR